MEIGKIEQLKSYNRKALENMLIEASVHDKFKDDLILVLRDLVEEIKLVKQELIYIQEKL